MNRKASIAVLASAALFVLTAGLHAQTAAGQGPPADPAAAQASSPSQGLGVYVYPRKQQPAAQQQKDEGECYAWAKEQTGIDPAAPAGTPQSPETPKGGAVKGAAGGAAAGAAIGAIAGDTGEGAAIGATAGAIRGRRAQRKAKKEAEKQAKQQAQAGQQERLGKVRNAFSACMDARQYSVK